MPCSRERCSATPAEAIRLRQELPSAVRAVILRPAWHIFLPPFLRADVVPALVLFLSVPGLRDVTTFAFPRFHPRQCLCRDPQGLFCRTVLLFAEQQSACAHGGAQHEMPGDGGSEHENSTNLKRHPKGVSSLVGWERRLATPGNQEGNGPLLGQGRR
eukprot:scaffold287_cov337-Pavlova_lutheri.AAC.246